MTRGLFRFFREIFSFPFGTKFIINFSIYLVKRCKFYLVFSSDTTYGFLYSTMNITFSLSHCPEIIGFWSSSGVWTIFRQIHNFVFVGEYVRQYFHYGKLGIIFDVEGVIEVEFVSSYENSVKKGLNYCFWVKG